MAALARLVRLSRHCPPRQPDGTQGIPAESPTLPGKDPQALNEELQQQQGPLLGPRETCMQGDASRLLPNSSAQLASVCLVAQQPSKPFAAAR